MTGVMLAAAGCGQAPSRRAQAARQQVAVGGQRAKPPAPPPPRKIDCDRARCVALTFDDGPGEYTARLLGTLRTAGARATFFMLGENVHAFRGVVRQMALDGHELANHTWSHPQLTALPTSKVRSEVQRTQAVIEEASGGVRPKLMRPPFGATDKRVGAVIGMPEILWSVDTLDWQHLDAARNVKVGVSEPKRGGIVLFHDIHKPSVNAVPKVLAGLKRRGFTFVTVSELFQNRTLEPGRTYTELAPKASPQPPGPPPGSPAGPPSATTPASPSAPASPSGPMNPAAPPQGAGPSGDAPSPPVADVRAPKVLAPSMLAPEVLSPLAR